MPQKSVATNGRNFSQRLLFPQRKVQPNTHIIHLQPFSHTSRSQFRCQPGWSVSQRERKEKEKCEQIHRSCADTRQNIYFSHPLQHGKRARALYGSTQSFFTHTPKVFPVLISFGGGLPFGPATWARSDLFIGLNQANAAAPLFPKLFFNSHSFSPLSDIFLSLGAPVLCVCVEKNKSAHL